MRISVASLACLAFAGLMLVVRGPADWSGSFAAFWYGTFGAAVVLAASAVVVAIGVSRGSRRDRVLAMCLALPALAAVPVLIWTIITLVPYAD